MKSFGASLLAVFVGLMFASQVQCEPRELNSDTPDKIDAVLLLDSSGSMLTTDPARLRDEGARLFVESLHQGDRLAIVEFSREAKIVHPLADYNPDQAEAVRQQISGIRNEGLYTDLLAAIRLAKATLEQNEREDASRVIVLLSDGKMEPDPAIGVGEVQARDLIDNVLPDLKAKGIKVHTLYFSELADKDLLQQIAAGTDGLNWYTPTSDKIHESYTSLFLAVKKPQVLPLSKKRFDIDANVQEATFYINREESSELTIVGPGGDRISASAHPPSVRWYRSQKFDVVTIYQPQVGHWELEGAVSQDSFATVLTNLKLVSDWNPNVYSGSASLIQATLYESEKPVLLSGMTQDAQFAYQITPTDRVSEPLVRDFLVDDGTHGDKIAGDGLFSASVLIDDPGEYRLSILLKAPTFERTQQIPFRVKPRLVSLRIEEEQAQASIGSEHGAEVSTKKYFVVELSPEASSVSKVQLKLAGVDNDAKSYSLPLTKAGEKGGVFRAGAASLPGEGEYKMQATLTGESKRQKVNEKSNILTYRHNPSGKEPEIVEVIVEHAEPVNKETPWWPHVLVVLLVNAGMGMFFLQQVKKMQTGEVVALPSFEGGPDFAAALSALRARSVVTEVDVNSPVFSREYKPAPPREPREDSGAAPESPPPDQEADLKQEDPGAQPDGEAAEEHDTVPEAEEEEGA